MRTTTDSGYNQSQTPANQAYSASVPLSVYRQLAVELQTAQTAIHQLNQQNQHLVQENQVLRQEITQTVNAVLHLQNAVNQNAVNSTPNAAQNNTSYPSSNQTPVEARQTQYPPQRKQRVPVKRVKRPSPPPPRHHQVTEFVEPLPEPIFIEEQEAGYYYPYESESQVSGWWLIFAIVFIIVMGFGAGYVVVRPLLENHTRNSN